MFRVRGEEFWIGDEHVANVRLTSGNQPYVLQMLDGTVGRRFDSRSKAELWVRVHGDEILETALNDRRMSRLVS